MTEYEERELIQRIARIDRRIGMLGGWAAGILVAFLADETYNKAIEGGWGSVAAMIIAIALGGVVGWYFIRHFDR